MTVLEWTPGEGAIPLLWAKGKAEGVGGISFFVPNFTKQTVL